MHTGVVLAVFPASAGQITPSPLSSTMHSEIPGKQNSTVFRCPRHCQQVIIRARGSSQPGHIPGTYRTNRIDGRRGFLAPGLCVRTSTYTRTRRICSAAEQCSAAALRPPAGWLRGQGGLLHTWPFPAHQLRMLLRVVLAGLQAPAETQTTQRSTLGSKKWIERIFEIS